jgi:hypothetical protein
MQTTQDLIDVKATPKRSAQAVGSDETQSVANIYFVLILFRARTL